MNAVNKVKTSEFGISKVKIVVSIFILLAIVLIVIVAIYNNNKTYTPSSFNSSSSSSIGSTYVTLTPATVPSKVAECSQTVTYDSNGTPGPVTCSNGDLNSQEWSTLSALEPSVLKLGYGASNSQVEAALCSDVQTNIKNNIELAAYHIAALYYGWNFTSDPSAVITNGTCVNTDD